MIALTKKIPASEGSLPCADSGVAQLIAREYAAVWRFLRRLGVPGSDVDDTAQRVFARVLARDERIQPGSERAYLMRAAFRAALEQQRAKKRWLSRASEVDLEEVSSAWPGPDQSLAQRQELELLDRALAELPPEMRAVLTLFELEGLTFTEISLRCSATRHGASRVRRARERFTKSFAGFERRLAMRAGRNGRWSEDASTPATRLMRAGQADALRRDAGAAPSRLRRAAAARLAPPSPSRRRCGALAEKRLSVWCSEMDRALRGLQLCMALVHAPGSHDLRRRAERPLPTERRALEGSPEPIRAQTQAVAKPVNRACPPAIITACDVRAKPLLEPPARR